VNIRQIKDDDIVKITAIYNWYILNTAITFEIEAISPLTMQQRVHEKLENHDWLVGESDQEIVGYAYYGAFHARAAYNHTVEATIYLAQEQTGKGYGKSLYGALMQSAKDHGFREAIGVIALPNSGSTTLHQKLGFSEVGVLKNVGYKFDRYIDVGIWQKSIA
jgi:L-amino acid N-acyltransferase YncA